MEQKKWILSAVLIGFMLTAVFSTVFAFSYLDHDCCGAKCSTCVLIERAHNLLKSLKTLVLISIFAACAFNCMHRIKPFRLVFIYTFTLHLLKVQFNT